jgi:hypothetical protein
MVNDVQWIELALLTTLTGNSNPANVGIYIYTNSYNLLLVANTNY